MKYFYKQMELEVPDSVYCPREDSELLARVMEEAELSRKKVLEAGCGSWLLSIIAAKHGADVTAVDISEDAVKVAKENKLALMLGKKVWIT